jgi:hypothetical protein
MTKTLATELSLRKFGSADDDAFIDFRIWNSDFGFKVFCLFNEWIERAYFAKLATQAKSDTTDPKSLAQTICRSKY